MKYIRLYEESNTTRKQRVYKALYNFVKILGGEIKITDGTILRAYNKYNKIDELYIEDLNTLMVGVSTIAGNDLKRYNKAYYYLSFSEMLKVIEYLKNKYPSEYEASKIIDDIEKYNL